jgi:hypothetical protein
MKVPTKAELVARVAALERELAEAREREAASGEILRLIAAAPGDLIAVLDGIVAGAVRLVGAEWGVLARFDGERLHLVTQRGASPEFLEMAAQVYPIAPHPDAASFRAMARRSLRKHTTCLPARRKSSASSRPNPLTTKSRKLALPWGERKGLVS